MARLPAKFLMKTHQKKRKERDRNEDEESDKSPSKLDPIPSDVEVEILSRLPGKSVIKFRCVSKMWSSIIRSQIFVDSFFSVSSRRSRFIIAFSNSRLFIFSSSHEGEESSSLAANLDMEIPSLTLAHGSNCPSLDGFIVSCHGAHFTICNPTTGQVITFPTKGTLTVLGYDPLHHQFKALSLLRSPSPPPGQDHYCEMHEVLTLGAGGESRNQVITPPYRPLTRGLCINGFVYYGAWSPAPTNPVIVCFDVRYERLSFIKVPKSVLSMQSDSMLIEYKGKLASIARPPFAPFHSFDLWILEDVKEHDWSKQTFELPFPLVNMTSPGTNKAGEIIFAPKTLPHDAQPFFILYYNLERKDIRRVQIHGIADDQGFRRRYRLSGSCCVSISPHHVESIASF
ncbi:unnamed protein product [Arabis nemorensis]|uniref:F-box domain-containing protein n=1 Tax=Arabis nemorensis TaxID=586526 RepID=A0A565ASJ1_9BRAS|nr:unnamed protein product [Arabis nemorensis]